MSELISKYGIPNDVLLGRRLMERVPRADQERQRCEVVEILRRLQHQPGLIVADEVGMGKTFVALAVGFSVAAQNPHGPVVVMVPPNLVDKWRGDLVTFCDLYLDNWNLVDCLKCDDSARKQPKTLRYGVAQKGVQLLRFLDDPKATRCHLIILTHGAMARGLDDAFTHLALIRETLRRYGRRSRLQAVKQQIHRFAGELLWARFRQYATVQKEDLWYELLRREPSEWKDYYNSNLKEGKEPLADDPVPGPVAKILPRIDLGNLADVLEKMPVHAVGGEDRISERITKARDQLRNETYELWKIILADARWRSPLLILDEAHHLKNPATEVHPKIRTTMIT